MSACTDPNCPSCNVKFDDSIDAVKLYFDSFYEPLFPQAIVGFITNVEIFPRIKYLYSKKQKPVMRFNRSSRK